MSTQVRKALHAFRAGKVQLAAAGDDVPLSVVLEDADDPEEAVDVGEAVDPVDPVDPVEAGVSGADAPLDAVAVALAFPVPLLRKSVTYQPVPLSWNPAAVNCFLKVLLEQAGQSVNGASDTFCNTSLAKPHSSQR
jgi:hypothetical protein